MPISTDTSSQLIGENGQAHITTGRLLETDRSTNLSPADISDLVSRLRFAIKDGRIWLDTQRVVLMHLSTLTTLRRELINTLGLNEARGFLTRMGFASGSRDALLARKLRPHHCSHDAYLLGPQLRILQGVSNSEPITLEIDIAAGHFYCETVVEESFEADAHLSTFGVSSLASCWLQTGYACGFSSTFMGRAIIHQETECRATGGRICRFVGKPVENWDDDNDLLQILEVELSPLGGHQSTARRQAPRPLHFPTPTTSSSATTTNQIVGTSSSFIAARHMIEKVCKTSATVLFFGETGVGKERFALLLHSLSQRADGPFITVNCAAIPDNLIEAELFGVEKGAYTGATGSRPGRFERADGGTLFLDEVGNLSLPAQVKLLRAIQEREFERVGGTAVLKSDVRIIAATNIDLKLAVKNNQFRRDLFYRLNVFPIHISPLRERRDDIPLLMSHFLNRYASLHGKRINGFSVRAVDTLYEYSYPGNIRELENMIERAVILADDEQAIDLAHLFTANDNITDEILKLDLTGSLNSSPEKPTSTADPSQLLDQFMSGNYSLGNLEQSLLFEAVERCNGNITRAASLLGLTRPQLAYRLKKYSTAPFTSQVSHR